MLLPDSRTRAATVRHLVGGRRQGRHLYVVDRDAMGKFSASGQYHLAAADGALPGGIWSTPAYFNGTVYYGRRWRTAQGVRGHQRQARRACRRRRLDTASRYPGHCAGSLRQRQQQRHRLGARRTATPRCCTPTTPTDLTHELYNSNQAAAAATSSAPATSSSPRPSPTARSSSAPRTASPCSACAVVRKQVSERPRAVPWAARSIRCGGWPRKAPATLRQIEYIHQLAQRAGADQRRRRLDIRGEEAVSVVAAGRCAARSRNTASSGRELVQRAVELDALRGGEQLDGDDVRGVGGHVEQPARAMGRHGDVVLLVGRGRHAVDAGRSGASDLFSDASAAAVTCAIMKPELTPARATRNGGRPLIFGSISSAMRRSAIAPISAMASASVSAAKATGSAWKLPPESTSPLVGEHQRVVGDGVRLEHAGCGRRCACRSRQAPITCGWQRRLVRVLHPLVAVAGARRGSRCRPAARGRSRRASIWPGWPRSAWMRGSNGASLPRAASTDSAPATSAAANTSSARTGRRAPARSRPACR